MVNYGGGAAVITVSPSGDTTGVTDAARIMAAVAKLPATGGVVAMEPSATWYIKAGQVVIATSGVYLDAPGCYILAVGAGDVIRMYDTNYFSRLVSGGGITGYPTIDGTSTTGNSAAIHAGDILQFKIDVAVQNFTAGTTSKGVWFDNQYYFTEQMSGRIRAQNCTSHVVFDVSGASTSTGSYDRADLQVYVNQGAATQDGVVFQNGAIIQDGPGLGIYGNFLTSASALTSAVLRLTGAVPGGHTGGNSQLANCGLSIGVECDGGLAHAPQTIVAGSVGSNTITGCGGVLDFSSFAASNMSSGFGFIGPITGDSALVQAQWQSVGSGFPSGWSGIIGYNYTQIATGIVSFLFRLSVAQNTVIANGTTIASGLPVAVRPQDSVYLDGNITGGGQSNVYAPGLIDSSGNFKYEGPGFTATGGAAFWYGQVTYTTAV